MNNNTKIQLDASSRSYQNFETIEWLSLSGKIFVHMCSNHAGSVVQAWILAKMSIWDIFIYLDGLEKWAKITIFRDFQPKFAVIPGFWA